MSDLGPLAIGVVVALALAPAMIRALREAGATRPNYRDRELAFPAGVAALVCGILALSVVVFLDAVAGTSLLAAGEGAGSGEAAGLVGLGVAATATAVLGVGMLGLADDLLPGSGRGWRGHAAALRRGELSTGALKAAGTLALAVVVLAGGEAWVVSVLLVALSTNLFNLLDLRPGRAAKGFAVVGAGLLVAGHPEPLRELGVWAGPLLVVGALDLRERAMLGDTGANALGVLAGLWLVLALGVTGEVVALAVVTALTAYGELRSFTATIDRVAPLRWVDRLGRRSHDAG